MTRLVLYLQGGVGDWYRLLMMMPEIIKQRKVDKIKIFMDSVYFHDKKFNTERETALTLLLPYTDDITIIPKEIGSWERLFYNDGTLEIEGPSYEKIKNVFMFYRKEITKKWIKERLEPDDVFIYAILNRHLYEWKDGVNILVNYPMVNDKILIHVRKKGWNSTSELYNKIIKYCRDKNKKVILIGHKGEIVINEYDNCTDLRNEIPFKECLDIIERCKYMISNSSLFGLHRAYFSNNPTIFLWPEYSGAGNPEATFDEKWILENPNFTFLNGDTVQFEEIKQVIDKWITN